MDGRRAAVAVTLLLGVLAASAPTAAHGGAIPDPAPFGPQREPEPYAPGPDNIDALDVTVTADGGAPGGVELTFDRLSRTESGEKPAAARRFVFLFDDSIRFNPTAFPVCARETLEEHGFDACPPGSRVGEGFAEGIAPEPVEVAVFNTVYPSGYRGVLITLPAAGTILENTFEPVSAPYQGKYTWGSDEILPPDDTPPQDRPATSRFLVSFGATITDSRGAEHSFISSTAHSGRALDFGVYAHFVTGQVLLLPDRAIRP